jgi:aspartyl-tRNA(Asn)/glutamyl-tRNA(Gln) amidotransferase subunit B
VEYAIKAGLATHCEIRTQNVFARKNYFYPDLPKGYQISQYEQPICEHGWIAIETEEGTKKIRICRIHLEEDAGKSIHQFGYSVVNLNRAGVPLIEIVTEPELKSAQEAGAYLRAIYALVTYLGICDGNMQEGNFRCDANVSVMPKGSDRYGTRVEIKNVNSFRFVEKAIDYEIGRQIEVIRSGGQVIQETRSFDSSRHMTLSLRTKEEAQDYRYFPDPDLVPLKIDPQWIESLRQGLPELPEQKRNRLIQEFGLSRYDAEELIASLQVVEFFESVIRIFQQRGVESQTVGKLVANWITSEITRLLNEEGIEISQSLFKPIHLADLVQLIQAQVLSSTGAKQVISIAWKTGDSIQEIVDREGLRQVSDFGALESVVEKVIASFPTQAAEFRGGKEKLLGFFVGQAMKEMSGKANPTLLSQIVRKKIFS